ncbi:hypothetical protein Acsp06_46870 [Actinomycetospora sp. NBRC 106375]|nr:hypothetical protein Acsp06_46870 [Actinomycetospora sp. NBRC 106375]
MGAAGDPGRSVVVLPGPSGPAGTEVRRRDPSTEVGATAVTASSPGGADGTAARTGDDGPEDGTAANASEDAARGQGSRTTVSVSAPPLGTATARSGSDPRAGATGPGDAPCRPPAEDTPPRATSPGDPCRSDASDASDAPWLPRGSASPGTASPATASSSSAGAACRGPNAGRAPSRRAWRPFGPRAPAPGGSAGAAMRTSVSRPRSASCPGDRCWAVGVAGARAGDSSRDATQRVKLATFRTG